MEDVANVLGMANKDLQRPGAASVLDHPSARQMAHVLPGLGDRIAASDFTKCGGELEALLQNRFILSCKKREKRAEHHISVEVKTIRSADAVVPKVGHLPMPRRWDMPSRL